MATLNDALVDLVTKGLVDSEEACAKAVDRGELDKQLAARDIKVAPGVGA